MEIYTKNDTMTICTMKEEHRIYTDILFFVFELDLLWLFIRFK